MNTEPNLALQTLFILDDVTLKLSGENQVIMSNHRTRSVIEISATMSNLISYCNIFRSLPAHHQYISERFNLTEDLKKELENTLKALYSYGMLLSASELNSQIFPPQNTKLQPNTNQWVLGIHSCDRSIMLERLLKSCIPHINAITIKPTFVFIDDSRDNKEEKKNYQILTHFCNEVNLKLCYWNRNQRSNFAKTLASERPELSSSIHWLLNPAAHAESENSTGLAKNFIQLFASNKKLLMIDDDCIITPKTIQENNFQNSLHPCQTQFSLFSNEYEMEKSIFSTPVNPFQEHLDHLGAPLCDLFDTESSLETWGDLPREIALELDPKQKVGFTINGIVGAQNTRHTDLLFKRAQNKPHLFESFLNTHSNKEPIKQLSWFGPTNPSTNKHVSFTCTTISGLGAVKLPALTLPTGRGQDSFLGELYAFLYPQALSHFFNWALPHDPIPTRTWLPEETPTTQAYRAIFALRKLIRESAQRCNQTSPEDRMAFLSRTLHDWSNVNNDTLRKNLTQAVTTTFSKDIYIWSDIQKKLDGSSTYNNHIEKLLKNLKSELMNTTKNIETVESDLKALSSPLVSAFKDWPDIINHVKQYAINNRLLDSQEPC